MGRAKLARLPVRLSWPLLVRLAAFHRSTVSRSTRLVSVVGSFGKTTTARAVAAALGLDAGLQDGRNTWGALVWKLLAVRPGDRHAVIEVGIRRPGEMRTFARMLQPDLAVVTCVGSEHHRSFGTLDATAREKAEMVGHLPADGVAVLNGDDPRVARMADVTAARVVTYGFGAGNTVRAEAAQIEWPRGTRVAFVAAGQRGEAHIRLIGRPMVYCFLAGLAAALAEGLDLARAVQSLEALEPTRGRLPPIPLAGGAFVLRDDQKSALETIDAALDVMAELPGRRRIVVLGSISEPPPGARAEYRRLGARVARVADRAVFVGNHCRAMAAGAAKAGAPRSALTTAGRRVSAAVEAVRADLRPGDVVLVKGRNMERLERVALALTGRAVRCDIPECRAHGFHSCERCPMLERGWDGLRPAT
jgi:UDP-N-acetylmuramyl pentapeptide synthase